MSSLLRVVAAEPDTVHRVRTSYARSRPNTLADMLVDLMKPWASASVTEAAGVDNLRRRLDRTIVVGDLETAIFPAEDCHSYRCGPGSLL